MIDLFVLAATSNPRDLVSLLGEVDKQAQDLTHAIQNTLASVRQQNQSHLDTTLDHQFHLIENFKMAYKLALVNKNIQIQFEDAHVMGEQLLQLQNEVLEQESAIYQVVKEHSQSKGLTHQQLLDWAHKVVKQAEEALAKLVSTQEKEPLTFQLKTVEALAQKIQGNTSAVGINYEQKLALHELTVHKLVTRANWRVNHPLIF